FGIFWFEDFETRRYGPRFTTAGDILLITETYVKGLAIDNHRLFFSIQRNKTDNSTLSRVANVCQKYTDSAPRSYVDMQLKCGDFNYLQAVEKTCYTEKCLIVATFTHGGHSVVCAYLFSEIKSSLAVNIKRCYNTTLQLPSGVYDYFNYWKRPCTGHPLNLSGINATDDFFLCNEEGYVTFSNVIGDTALQMNVSVRLNHTVVTALALVSVRGRVLALLGTAQGEIIKALVFPREEAEVLPWKAVVDSGHAVLPDMFVHGYTMYAFSENVVRKIELADCSKCTTTIECSNSEWILAEGLARVCPHINQTSPNAIRTDESTEVLTLTLSHNMSIGLELRCQFESLVDNKTILMNSSVPGVARGDEVPPVCLSYSSQTFLLWLCRKCSFSRWTCAWCPLQGRCIKENNSCNGNESSVEIRERSSCPHVTDYTVSPQNVLNGHGDAHLAIEESYNITVKGVNFIETNGSANYQCSVKHSEKNGEEKFAATRMNDSEIMCHITNLKGGMPWNLDSASSLHVDLQSKQLDGPSFKVVFYQCGSLIYPPTNCGQCESFKYYQPYLRCQWCNGKCIYAGEPCAAAGTMCPDPVITKVYPLSSHINAITPITVEGYNLGSHPNETLNAVSVGNISCDTMYNANVVNISTRITCKLGPSERETTENVIVNISGHNPVVYEKYSFNIPRITRIFPNYGPFSGGTNVTIYGEHLDTGWERTIQIGEQLCGLVTVPAFIKPNMAECRTVKFNSTTQTNATVSMVFDNQAVEGVNFTYVPDPVVWNIQPRKSFESGGRVLTVTGLNLLSVQTPKLKAQTSDGMTSVEMSCIRGKPDDLADSKFNGYLTCRSPIFSSRESRPRANRSSEVPRSMEVSFTMDDVDSVKNLPANISVIRYYPDPTIDNFTETQRNFQGDHLNVAASAEDVQVFVDCEECNVTTLEHNRIICNPPTSAPKCNVAGQTLFTIKVRIGFLEREVGKMGYGSSEPNTDCKNIQLIGGLVGAGMIFVFVLSVIAFYFKSKNRVF
ncbi:PLXB3-like protein, partial [Mya arenaria]